MSAAPSRAVVYSETVVYSAPPRLESDVPYQLAMLDLPTGERLTVRIAAANPDEFIKVGDQVEFVEDRQGVPFYRRSPAIVRAEI